MMRNHALRLAAAVAISALAHAVLVSGGWMALPREPEDPKPLAVVLKPLQPAPPAVVREPAREPLVKPPRAARPAAQPAQPVVVARGPDTAVPDFSPTAVEPAPVAAPAAAPAPAPAEPPAKAVPGQVAVAPVTMAAPEPEPIRSLPRRGRIAYNLYFGMEKFNVGRTVQTWEVSGTRYRLDSISETTGVVDLLRSERRTYASRGSITAGGLKPEEFRTERVRRGQSESAKANFGWGDGRLTFGDAGVVRNEPMPQGSQDIVSFMYQVGLNPPPPGRLKLAITNGSKFEEYELEVLPEEFIETPIGRLRALPLKQVRRPDAESIQIWLAAEYRYLPVKIRFMDKQGQPSGEQVVSEISVSEDAS